jgi:hypothetical protein
MPAKKGVLLLGVLLAGGFFQVKAVFGSYEIDKNAPRDKPVSIQIAAIPQSIRVGEPILLKVTCTFSRPQIHLQTREIVGSIYKENILFVEVKDKSRMPPRRKYVSIDGKEYEAHYLLLRKFFLWDAKGLVYSNYCSVYLAPEKAGRNEKDIFTSFLFDEPGRYTIFIDQGEAKSNRLTIDVSPPAKTSSILIPMRDSLRESIRRHPHLISRFFR